MKIRYSSSSNRNYKTVLRLGESHKEFAFGETDVGGWTIHGCQRWSLRIWTEEGKELDQGCVCFSKREG